MKVCGRCGEKSERDDGSPIGPTFTIRTPGGAVFDICVTCARSFDHWLGHFLSDPGRSVPEGADPWTSRVDRA